MPDFDPQDNSRHWKALFQTDPRHTRAFVRPGGFRGTSIDPLWRVMRLTEHFGPQGVGWGTETPDFKVVDVGEEILVYCIVKCWYRDGDDSDPCYIYGIGGDKVATKRPGQTFADDEAFKKAYTDAVMNGFIRLGLSADVSLGLHSDNKYLAATRERFDNSRAIENNLNKPSDPNSK